jgi:hypothetical protein
VAEIHVLGFDREMRLLLRHVRANYPELASMTDGGIVAVIVDTAGQLVPLADRFAAALRLEKGAADRLLGEWISGGYRRRPA